MYKLFSLMSLCRPKNDHTMLYKTLTFAHGAWIHVHAMYNNGVNAYAYAYRIVCAWCLLLYISLKIQMHMVLIFFFHMNSHSFSKIYLQNTTLLWNFSAAKILLSFDPAMKNLLGILYSNYFNTNLWILT